MWKKLTALSLSFVFLLLSCMNIQCRVKLNGQLLEGTFSPRVFNQCVLAATMASEEIIEGLPSMPEPKKKYRLSFKCPDNNCPVLTDALLRSVEGIELVDAVFVNGVQLGCVENGPQLYEHLRSFIRNQMPTSAVSGTISGRLSIHKLYSRKDQETSYNDMVLLISGMAPVIYLDDKGKLV